MSREVFRSAPEPEKQLALSSLLDAPLAALQQRDAFEWWAAGL